MNDMVKSGVKDRAFRALNLAQFSQINYPTEVGFMNIQCPYETQMVLRCLVKELNSGFKFPEELQWLSQTIESLFNYQKNTIGVIHPFCYVTVRHGVVSSVLDDEYHSDGFSMTTTHLPQHNYIWADRDPTEYVLREFDIPDDFSPFEHNIHEFFQDEINADDTLYLCKPKTFYVFDPYVVHRRPPNTCGMNRTFIKISFTPIEIEDINNTQNPLLPRSHTRSGVRDFRNNLKRYTRK